jgi:uncharacterized protein (DUF885 family)
MQDSHTQLACQYFDELAARFPVMCASDEFHFLPRAQAASRYYDRLDELDGQAIAETVRLLHRYRDQFEALRAQEHDLERRTDLELLTASAAGILLELEQNRSWCHNPLLYLKIGFIGLDHALTKPAADQQETRERALARLSAIPRLLQQATANLDQVPASYLHATLGMVADCARYLGEIGEHPTDSRFASLRNAVQAVRSALAAFGEFLRRFVPIPDDHWNAPPLEAMLRDQFLCQRSLSEIFQIAVEEWSENLAQLDDLQWRIDQSRSWNELYHGYCPAAVAHVDTFSLYRQEVEKLQRFFLGHGFHWLIPRRLPQVRETPTYLQSVRSSASFSAAFSSDAREIDFFYITTCLPRHRGSEAAELLRRRLHREYRFLAAHETIPGHFLLDSIRRSLQNSVRSQIESALFYEGWAYYVESLLGEYDYLENPLERLVDCKRRLWRAARCQIDIGLHTGQLTPNDAVRLLVTAGFSAEEASDQVRRFRLNPGYQLCYSLGRYEILRLRERFAPRLGRDVFHRTLLEGGELPFHLAARRLEAMSLEES